MPAKVGKFTHVLLQVWRSEDNLKELIFSFHVGPENGTLVLRPDSEHPYLLSHLSLPLVSDACF